MRSRIARRISRLIGNFFRWFGAVARGNAPYDEAEAAKRAERIGFLAGLLDEDPFREVSNVGDPASKANAEIWKQCANSTRSSRNSRMDARAFHEAIAKEKGATDALQDRGRLSRAGLQGLSRHLQGEIVGRATNDHRRKEARGAISSADGEDRTARVGLAATDRALVLGRLLCRSVRHQSAGRRLVRLACALRLCGSGTCRLSSDVGILSAPSTRDL